MIRKQHIQSLKAKFDSKTLSTSEVLMVNFHSDNFSSTPPLNIVSSKLNNSITGTVKLETLKSASTSNIRYVCFNETNPPLGFVFINNLNNTNPQLNLYSSSDLMEIIKNIPLSPCNSVNELSMQNSIYLSLAMVLSWIEVELSSEVLKAYL